MAAISSAGTGVVKNWSDPAAWSGGVVPGDGDTATITGGDRITVASDTTIGNDSGSAIQISGGVTDCALVLGPGATLTVKGNIQVSQYNKTASLTLNAGGTLRMYPASGATLAVSSSNDTRFSILANGTAGARCVVTTDRSRGGLNSHMHGIGTHGPNGVQTATYTDFSNWGDATHYGIMSRCEGSGAWADADITITDCTFDNANYRIYDADTAWDGDFTFQRNRFTNSVSSSGLNGGLVASFYGSLNAERIGGARIVSFCAFDKGLLSTARNHISYQDNVFAQSVAGGSPFDVLGSAVQWSSGDDFLRNVCALPAEATADLRVRVAGPLKDLYIVHGRPDNPHHIGTVASPSCVGTVTLDGVVLEAPWCSGAIADAGDGLLTGAMLSSTTFRLRNWIVLPNGSDGTTPGNAFTLMQPATNVTIDCEHCTLISGKQPAAGYSEGSPSNAPGQIASYRANLVWTPAAKQASASLLLGDTGHYLSGGAQDVASPASADYNASWNCHVENPSAYPGNTYTYAGRGYQGNFSSTPGVHDLGDGDPQFLDAARNIATWYTVAQGQATTGSYTGDAAAAVAYLAADPARIGQAGTGLFAWVRAGFAPKSTALRAASYPGDASAVDANGNPWPGGAPGIGAMGWTSGGGGGGGGTLFYGRALNGGMATLG